MFYDQDAGGKAATPMSASSASATGRGGWPKAEAAINGHAVDDATIAKAAEAASAEVEAQDDIHASAAYRRALDRHAWSSARSRARRVMP